VEYFVAAFDGSGGSGAAVCLRRATMDGKAAGLQTEESPELGKLRETDVHPSQNCFGGQAAVGVKVPQSA
jgi:hypothetical protein